MLGNLTRSLKGTKQNYYVKKNNFTLKRSCNITQSAVANLNSLLFVKVEKISKGSLDSIPSPSPSMKIQTMGVKVCLIIPQVNFSVNNLNRH